MNGKSSTKKNNKKAELFITTPLKNLVTKLGFEPRTPSLKGMCSTC